MSATLVSIYTTCPTHDVALSLAKVLVQEKLVACANIFGPGSSVYMWDGRLHEEQEVYMLLKTTPNLAERAIRRLEALHPYEVPAVMAWTQSHTSKGYFDWANNAVLGR